MMAFSQTKKVIISRVRFIEEFVHHYFVQISIVGMCTAISRGSINALNSFGAYGTEDLDATKKINIINYCTYTIFSWWSGVVISFLGFRLACLIPTLVSFLYVLCMHLSLNLKVWPRSLVFALAFLDGTTSSWLATSANSMILLYSKPLNKGLANSVYHNSFSIFASLCGLLLILFEYYREHDAALFGYANAHEFIITVMLSSPVLTFFICSQDNVIKDEAVTNDSAIETKSTTDGEIQTKKNALRILIDLMKDPYYLMLCPLGFICFYHQIYLFSGINYDSDYKVIRGYNVIAYWLGRIPGCYLFSHTIDDKETSDLSKSKKLIMIGSLLLVLEHLIVLFVFISINYEFSNTKAMYTIVVLDFILYGMMETFGQSIALWFISLKTDNDKTVISHACSIYKGYLGVGSTLSWALTLIPSISYMHLIILGIFTWTFTMWLLRYGLIQICNNKKLTLL